MTQLYTCFATIPKGLEVILCDEISALGGKGAKVARAGVEFAADFTTIMHINLNSRLASRILLQISSCEYKTEEDIYNLAYNVPWEKWFNPEYTIKVVTNSIGSRLKSLNFITLRVKDAVCDRFVANSNSRPTVDKKTPDIQLYVFLTANTVSLYIDTSGESLFKRGYRKDKLSAPLKENLAFSLLALTNWQPEVPLYDPMCGSGTIVLEALIYALKIPPGILRNFAFEKLNLFDKKKWLEIKNSACNQIKQDVNVQLFANDIDKKAVDVAKENYDYLMQSIKRLECFQEKYTTPRPKLSLKNKKPVPLKNVKQVADFPDFSHLINFTCGDFVKHNSPCQTGVMVSNLPYGVRLNEQPLLSSEYPKWASHLKQKYAGWICYLLTSDLTMPKLMRLKPSRKIPLYNGNLECRLFEFKMVSGSNRSN